MEPMVAFQGVRAMYEAEEKQVALRNGHAMDDDSVGARVMGAFLAGYSILDALAETAVSHGGRVERNVALAMAASQRGHAMSVADEAIAVVRTFPEASALDGEMTVFHRYHAAFENAVEADLRIYRAAAAVAVEMNDAGREHLPYRDHSLEVSAG